jgi:hypothetical protein
MALDEPQRIDVVSLDKAGTTVILTMVETRSWGTRGDLLADFQAKLNTYLAYALDGEMLEHYPQVAGKRICFRLHSVFPPGPEEQRFIEIVCRQHLAPAGIGWEQELLPPD